MNMEGRYQEHLVTSLVGNDISLADHLWNTLCDGFPDLLSCLHDYAQIRGWSEKKLQDNGAQEFLAASKDALAPCDVTPPAQWQQLWAQGILWWTPEYGLELHSGALAILNQREALLHRLWRGQSSYLLQVIDSVRLAFCEYLTKIYGKTWPVQWCCPESAEEEKAVRDSPFACQWGYLEWLLKNCNAFQNERGRLMSLASQMRYIRNKLAHYQPVCLNDLLVVQQEIRRVQKMGITFSVVM